jgi:transforming growth factor-beta-induced protein
MRRIRHRITAVAIGSVFGLAGALVPGLAQADDETASVQVQIESTQSESPEVATPAGKNIVAKLAKAGNFTTLITAVQAAGLADTLATTNNITVFAPTDAAFAKIPADTLKAIVNDKALLTDILTYHVSPNRLRESSLARRGSAKTLYGADIAVTGMPEDLVLNGNVNITLGDIRATNGIIHAIDTVLTPPAKPKDIVDTAIGAGQFSTLVAAVQAAGLEETLRTTQNITVFAPTDAAFAKLGKETIDAVLADKATLTAILTYHVAGRVIPASKILAAGNGSFKTLQGGRVRFAVVDGGVVLNDSVKVLVTDVKASNGIIHVIDTVLIPPTH